MTDFKALARAAAIEAHGDSAVGDFIDAVQEPDAGVITYLFASKLKGYPDWRISVTLFQDGRSATVSELLVVPGPDSLTAPAWVPWSERLADYKALQAALEAEAAAAAELAASGEDADEDESDEDDADDDIDDIAEDLVLDETDNEATELALANVPVAVDSEDDANATSGKSKGFFKWKTLRGGKKRK